MRTAAEAFGPEIADRLARLAIDIGCAVPERITTAETKVRASLIEELREVLEEAGVDWRQLTRAYFAERKEIGRRYYAERREERGHPL